MKHYRSIAVFRPAGLGDFIMSTPALAGLRQRFPDARITLVTLHSQSADQAAKVSVYAGDTRAAPWVELVRPHLIDDYRVLPPIRTFADLFETRRIMADVRADLVVHLIDPGTPYVRRAKKMALMAAACGPVRQIGWSQSGQIHDRAPPPVDPHIGHHVTGLAQCLRDLYGRTLTSTDIMFDLRPGPAADQWATEWLAGHQLTGRQLVAVAAGAIHDHKQWPIEKFAALIAALIERHADASFLIMGTAKDAPLAAALTNVDPGRIHPLCGTSSIQQSAALFRHCALVVGNDGGAMHLADAMGVPVVSIVPGLEYPNSVEPWHNRDRAVRHPIHCAPCYSFSYCPEGHRRCMLDLPLADVLVQCERALASGAPA